MAVNPFDAIDDRLCNLEKLVSSLSHQLNSKVSDSQNDIIGIKQVAEILHLSVDTIYTKTHRKLIPHRKEGKKLLFSRKEIEQYISNKKVKTLQEEFEENEVN